MSYDATVRASAANINLKTIIFTFLQCMCSSCHVEVDNSWRVGWQVWFFPLEREAWDITSILHIYMIYCTMRERYTIKKVGTEDVDSAGMLASKTDWKIIDDSDQFSNVISLIVFLITRKWVNFYFSAFCFFRIWFWTWQHDPFHTKIDKLASFVFSKSCCLWVFSPRIWNVFWMCFSLKNLLHHLKKWRDDPEITKKLFFCLILGLKIC